MRISDWSSDVCSSDLRPFPPIWPRIMQIPGHIDPVTTGTVPLRGGNRIDLVGLTRDAIGGVLVEAGLDAKAAKLRAKQIWHWIYRSEEHTSELQSLMRISYAVFCLKQTKHMNTYHHNVT